MSINISNTVCPISFFLKKARLFFLAFALSVPFLAQGIPISTGLSVVSFVLLFGSFLANFNIRSLGRIAFAEWVLFASSFLLICVIYFSLTDLSFSFYYEIYRVLIVSFTVLCLVVFVESKAEMLRLVFYFSIFIIFISVFLALLSLVKFALLEMNVYIPIVFSGNGGRYPDGSSLVTDYNFFAYTLLAGLVFLIHFGATQKNNVLVFLLIFFGGVILYSGYATGSRRFLIMAFFVFIAYSVFFLMNSSVNKVKGLFFLVGLVVVSYICSVFLDGVLSYFNTKDIVHILGSNDGSFGAYGLYKDGLEHINHQNVRSSLIDESQAYGLRARLDRWLYSVEVLSQNYNWIYGIGLDYRYAFGCRFVQCGATDHPHNPLLSAWLYGGIVGAILVLIWLFTSIWATLRKLILSKFFIGSFVVSVFALITLPFLLISSDTLYNGMSALYGVALAYRFSKNIE